MAVSTHVSLVLSGGVALGAYEAGAYAALSRRGDLRPTHLAGASIGAVNAALVAGGAPEEAVERLRAFWDAMVWEPSPAASLPGFGPFLPRHSGNWLNVLQTRLGGHPRLFRPRLAALSFGRATSLYDLAPLAETLAAQIDFGRLNGGETRVSVVATDVATGEAVLFDTARGDRIGVEHLLASCAFLPEFPPVEIGGRCLADGGLVANAPVEVVLDGEPATAGRHLCFVADLFSAEGGRPQGLEEAAARRGDLLFGNQTRRMLEALVRERRLLAALHHSDARDRAPEPELAALLAGDAPVPLSVFHLSYRAPAHEAGPEKPYDFTRASLAERWNVGIRDMEEALRRFDQDEDGANFAIHRIGGAALHSFCRRNIGGASRFGEAWGRSAPKGGASMENGDSHEERVRARAHQIWEREGRKDGEHERHWQEAMEELRNEDAGQSLGGSAGGEAGSSGTRQEDDAVVVERTEQPNAQRGSGG